VSSSSAPIGEVTGAATEYTCELCLSEDAGRIHRRPHDGSTRRGRKPNSGARGVAEDL
jgi:hypothetical protein